MKKGYFLISLIITALTTITFQKASAQSTLVHFWYFDASIPNDTPLTSLDATYSLAGDQVRLEYESALAGYPFTSDDPNWRKASMERRNSPTQINYRSTANNGLPYNASDMRGIQIKQPFKGDGGRNKMIFHLPTIGYDEIVFSFAAKNEGAAESLIIDYSVHEDHIWTTDGMEQSIFPITDHYLLFRIDFSTQGSNISNANDNPYFKIRIQFDGDNMETDNGQRVVFNNISLVSGTNEPPVVTNPIPLQKTIANSAGTMIDLSTIFSDPDGDPLTFASNSNRPEIVKPLIDGNSLTLDAKKPGDAIINVSANDGNHPEVELSFRVLVYPEAFDMGSGDFSFTHWSSEQPDYSYPDNMIFLQTDVSDPALNNELLFPYYIPHDDYHENDIATAGFPYNNSNRTRITGLNDHGIAFINTGRNRDLGGALVALNTTNQQNLSLSFLAGTLLRNERLYALRLQYRVGTEGNFADIRSGGSPVQYVVANDGDVYHFDNIELPQAILGQEYVQILWRYFLFSGDSGPRSMLRLDDINITRNTGLALENEHAARIYSLNGRIYIEDIPHQSMQLTIYNLMGQKVHTQSIIDSNAMSIDLPVSPGAYIVVLNTPDNTISRKIILH